MPFVIDLEFEEAMTPNTGRGQGLLRTLVNVSIRPQRGRDRRRRDVLERARQLLFSLKSYLVAQEQNPEALITPSPQPAEHVAGMLELAQRELAPWTSKKN